MRYVSLIKSRFSFAVAKNMQASLIVGSIDSQSQDIILESSASQTLKVWSSFASPGLIKWSSRPCLSSRSGPIVTTSDNFFHKSIRYPDSIANHRLLDGTIFTSRSGLASDSGFISGHNVHREQQQQKMWRQQCRLHERK